MAQVKEEFKREQQDIKQSLEQQTHELMGDTPINLAAPEQLSMVVYSRKPKDKATWSENFTKYMKKKDFNKKYGEGTKFDLDYGKLLIIALCIYIAFKV